MNLHHYIRILRQGALLLVALTCLGGIGGYLLASIATPNFQASATVYVTATGSGSASDLQQGNVFAMQKAPTYAALATTAPVLERAVDTLGDDTAVDELRGAISASARSNTGIIDVRGNGSDPVMVAAWINAVAQALTGEVARLDAPSVGEGDVPGIPQLSVSVIDPAQIPTVAVSPQPRYNVFVGSVVGLALAIAFLVLRHALDTRIRSLGDVPRPVEFATLTTIPVTARRLFRGGEGDERLEAFRTLRANLLFGAQVGNAIAVAGVDSATDSRAIARQLGVVLGEIGARAVILDLDLRPVRGSRRRGQGGPNASAVGVADVLGGLATLPDSTNSTEHENVFTISAGQVDQASAQMLSTTRMKSMLDQLRRDYNYVVLACPPLVERSESAVVAAMAESSLVVVEAGRTSKPDFLFAIELLEGVRVQSMSVAVHNVREGGMAAAARTPLAIEA